MQHGSDDNHRLHEFDALRCRVHEKVERYSISGFGETAKSVGCSHGIRCAAKKRKRATPPEAVGPFDILILGKGVLCFPRKRPFARDGGGVFHVLIGNAGRICIEGKFLRHDIEVRVDRFFEVDQLAAPGSDSTEGGSE